MLFFFTEVYWISRDSNDFAFLIIIIHNEAQDLAHGDRRRRGDGGGGRRNHEQTNIFNGKESNFVSFYLFLLTPCNGMPI